MKSTSLHSNEEIDLKNLFLTLWAHKAIISFFSILFFIISGWYSLNLEKKYTARALFNLQISNSEIGGIGKRESSIALLTGISDKNSPLEKIREQTHSRIFIENINKELDFISDSYFNSYDPNFVEPLWKSKLKNLIGYQTSFVNKKEIMWQSVINNFKNNIKFELTEASNISIKVTHLIPERAAKIANSVMRHIINQSRTKQNNAVNEQLNYLSTTLASSQKKLEDAESAQQNFAIQNSINPEYVFAEYTLDIEETNKLLGSTKSLIDAGNEVLNIIKSNNTTIEKYDLARTKHPIINSLEFRSIFFQDENVVSWEWPKVDLTESVIRTLLNRKNRLNNTLIEQQNRAKAYSKKLEKYFSLVREYEIARATYTVLIEQVKTNTLLAGYRPEKTEIYEYAASPIHPSAPDRNLIVAIGTLLGIFIGTVFSLIYAARKDVFYSHSSLMKATSASYSSGLSGYHKFRNKDFKQLKKNISYKNIQVLQNLYFEIKQSKKRLILVSNLGSRLKAKDFAKILSINFQNQEQRIAYIDLDKKRTNSDLKDLDVVKYQDNDFNLIQNFENIFELESSTNDGHIDFLKSKNAIINIKSLEKDFDLIIISINNQGKNNIVRALTAKEVFHIALARKRKTKCKDMHIIQKYLPLGAILYD